MLTLKYSQFCYNVTRVSKIQHTMQNLPTKNTELIGKIGLGHDRMLKSFISDIFFKFRNVKIGGTVYTC